MERFFTEKCGIAYHQLLSETRIGFPTVKVEAEFEKPLVYGDDVDVLIDVLNLSQHSVTFNYRLLRATDMIKCAEVTMVHVAMNLDSRRAIEIPSALRQPMEVLKKMS